MLINETNCSHLLRKLFQSSCLIFGFVLDNSPQWIIWKYVLPASNFCIHLLVSCSLHVCSRHYHKKCIENKNKEVYILSELDKSRKKDKA